MLVGKKDFGRASGDSIRKEVSGEQRSSHAVRLAGVLGQLFAIGDTSLMSENEVRGNPSAGQVIAGSVCEKDHKGWVDTM